MKKFSTLAFVSVASAGAAYAQGRPVDWSFFGGDAQRTGWEKVDLRITKDNVKEFQLVLKRKFDTKQKGPRSLAPPVVIGNLISYKGFKELAFVPVGPDSLWALDADLDRVFWQRTFEVSGGKSKGGSSACAGSITAIPSLTPPINFSARPRPTTPAATPSPSPGVPPSPAGAPAPGGGRGILGAGGFGAARPAFAVSSDGKLHLLNTSNGEDVTPAINFLPANSKASNLAVFEGALYTTTASGCGNSTDAVWATDLASTDVNSAPEVATFAFPGASASKSGGFAIGTDGTVYVQTGAGAFDPASNKWGATLLALTPKVLKLKSYFTTGSMPASKANAGTSAATPVVFAYKGRDLVVSAGADGRLYLLDSKSVGGDDHKSFLAQTAVLSSGGPGVWGGLSSWQDPDGTRWVFAPVWGALNAELKPLVSNGAAAEGSIVAFKVEEQNGKPALIPAWVSRGMSSPEAPVITEGLVFALSAGDYSREDRPKSSSRATLYALDAVTGKEMYSSGSQVTGPASLTGLTLANGRVYFATTDGTLYAFGIFLER